METETNSKQEKKSSKSKKVWIAVYSILIIIVGLALFVVYFGKAMQNTN